MIEIQTVGLNSAETEFSKIMPDLLCVRDIQKGPVWFFPSIKIHQMMWSKVLQVLWTRGSSTYMKYQLLLNYHRIEYES